MITISVSMGDSFIEESVDVFERRDLAMFENIANYIGLDVCFIDERGNIVRDIGGYSNLKEE